MDVEGSMKATESRSPHKYSPVLVGRGYRHQAVNLVAVLQAMQVKLMIKDLSVEWNAMVWGKEAMRQHGDQTQDGCHSGR